MGEVSLTDAFAKSVNTVAVKLSENVGRDKVIKWQILWVSIVRL